VASSGSHESCRRDVTKKYFAEQVFFTYLLTYLHRPILHSQPSAAITSCFLIVCSSGLFLPLAGIGCYRCRNTQFRFPSRRPLTLIVSFHSGRIAVEKVAFQDACRTGDDFTTVENTDWNVDSGCDPNLTSFLHLLATVELPVFNTGSSAPMNFYRYLSACAVTNR
jgi:hypothetical protein